MAAKAETNSANTAAGRRRAAAGPRAGGGRRSAPGRKSALGKKATARKRTRSAPPDFAARAREAGRNAFLASLGFYGKAFDQAQEQFSNMQAQLEERRAKADTLYQELVNRGKKVEEDAREALQDLDLPGLELDSLTDRKRLEEQLEKARARFTELKESMGLKSAD